MNLLNFLKGLFSSKTFSVDNQLVIKANERPVDTHDWDIGDVPAPTTVPSFVPHIYNQGSIEPSCGAGMCATMLNFLFPGLVSSMQFIWIQNRLLDRLPITFGSDMRTLFKALQNSGSCDETMLEQNVQEPLASYVSPANLTRAMVLNAMPRRIKFYGFRNGPFTWDSLTQTINLYHVVAAVIKLGNRFYQDAQGNNNYNPLVIFPLQYGTPVSQHFITLISTDVAKLYGINPNPQYQYFVNDWSSAYGMNGLGWFDSSYLPYVLEIGAVA